MVVSTLFLLQTAVAAAPVARHAEPASTVMAFDITDTGTVENCTVVQSSGNAALDAQACKITTDKARYTPAVDADGNPKRVPGRLTVTWKLPE